MKESLAWVSSIDFGLVVFVQNLRGLVKRALVRMHLPRRYYLYIKGQILRARTTLWKYRNRCLVKEDSTIRV